MLTKYYLNGGGSSAETPTNLEFRKNLIADIQANPKVVFCYFARPVEDWDTRFESDRNIFSAVDSKLTFEIATEDNFEQLCKEAGLIVLSGGDSFLLVEKLKRYGNLQELFKGKVVFGTSAGACALSKYFFSNDEHRVGDGLGILNIKVHCHYSADKVGNIEILRNYKEDLDIVALAEQHSVAIYK